MVVSAAPRAGRRAAAAGCGAGLLGGVCCLGSALATGAGIGGLSFFTVWMDRYQGYFMAASLALVGVWVWRLGGRSGLRAFGFRRTMRLVGRHVAAMALVYVATVGLAALAARAAGAM